MLPSLVLWQPRRSPVRECPHPKTCGPGCEYCLAFPPAQYCPNLGAQSLAVFCKPTTQRRQVPLKIETVCGCPSQSGSARSRPRRIRRGSTPKPVFPMHPAVCWQTQPPIALLASERYGMPGRHEPCHPRNFSSNEPCRRQSGWHRRLARRHWLCGPTSGRVDLKMRRRSLLTGHELNVSARHGKNPSDLSTVWRHNTEDL